MKERKIPEQLAVEGTFELELIEFYNGVGPAGSSFDGIGFKALVVDSTVPNQIGKETTVLLFNPKSSQSKEGQRIFRDAIRRTLAVLGQEPGISEMYPNSYASRIDPKKSVGITFVAQLRADDWNGKTRMRLFYDHIWNSESEKKMIEYFWGRRLKPGRREQLEEDGIFELRITETFDKVSRSGKPIKGFGFTAQVVKGTTPDQVGKQVTVFLFSPTEKQSSGQQKLARRSQVKALLALGVIVPQQLGTKIEKVELPEAIGKRIVAKLKADKRGEKTFMRLDYDNIWSVDEFAKKVVSNPSYCLDN